MPQKKPKKRIAVTLRFEPAAMALLEADRREISNGGPASTRSSYLKHAALSYPRLRKIETDLRKLESNLRSHIGSMFCGQVITEATLKSLTEAQ